MSEAKTKSDMMPKSEVTKSHVKHLRFGDGVQFGTKSCTSISVTDGAEIVQNSQATGFYVTLRGTRYFTPNAITRFAEFVLGE